MIPLILQLALEVSEAEATKEDPSPTEAVSTPVMREVSLALGYGLPTGPSLYVNPFGFNVGTRVHWVMGGPALQFLIGPGFTLWIPPHRAYFDQTVEATVGALTGELGLRWVVPDTGLSLELLGSLGAGLLKYGVEHSHGGPTAVGGGGVGIGYRISPSFSLSLEARALAFPGFQVPNSDATLVGWCPGLGASWQF